MMFGIVALFLSLLYHFVDSEITFAVLGDWDDRSAEGLQRQTRVSHIMNEWCEERRCDFLLSVGESALPGQSRIQKARFSRMWRRIYGGHAIKHLKWYMSLGGHNEDYQVQQLQYAVAHDKWYLPWYYYSFEMHDDTTSAVFYSMDSGSIRSNKHDPERQLTEMEIAMRNDVSWRIVFGHHSPLSAGSSAGDQIVLEQVVPLCEENDVDVMITGHEHNLQHITSTESSRATHFIVNGAGGQLKEDYNQDNEDAINDLGYRSRFFDSTYGFVGITLKRDSMVVEYYDYKVQGKRLNKRLLHTFTRYKNVES